MNHNNCKVGSFSLDLYFYYFHLSQILERNTLLFKYAAQDIFQTYIKSITSTITNLKVSMLCQWFQRIEQAFSVFSLHFYFHLG